MISGRKLLIADDSATIQKVVDLTFSDEGMEVTTAGDGDEAIAKLEEVAPDVVLADVYMPGRTGYEVCEAIKHDERFHNIPVMLLVGSFEPFDEAEARRVGADDVLTKPFQSIRQLVNRVGTLISGKPAGEEATTRRLSTLGLETSHEAQDQSNRKDESDELMSTAELELTTADTQPLDERQTEDSDAIANAGDDSIESAEAEPSLDIANSFSVGSSTPDRDGSSWADRLADDSEPAPPNHREEESFRVEPMDNTSGQRVVASVDDFDGGLLDLGDLDSVPARATFAEGILELEDEAPAAPNTIARVYEPAWEAETSSATEDAPASLDRDSGGAYESEFASGWSDTLPIDTSQGADHESGTRELTAGAAWEIVPPAVPLERVTDEEPSSALVEEQASAPAWMEEAGEVVTQPGEIAAPPSEIHPEPRDIVSESSDRVPAAAGATHLSPEDIEAIARKVVEQMSDKAVREIAWEVVPELAELLIKRRLEEE